MNTTVSILLDQVASATKAVSMIHRDNNVEIAITSESERVVMPSELSYAISEVISSYVEEQKEIIAKIMDEESKE